MTLLQLKYIDEITKCGSINKASQNLYVSQPCISNSIKSLENEFRFTIFKRTNRGVELTAEGANFISYARQLLERAEIIESKFSSDDSQSKVRFSISTQHYAFAIKAFTQFVNQTENNKYEFNYRETKTFEIIEDVYSKHSDIGIIYICNATKEFIFRILSAKGLEFNKLYTLEPHIFINKSHPLADHKYIELSDLQSYPYVRFEQGSNSPITFSEEMQLIENSNKTIYAPDRASLNSLLAHTNCYTVGTGHIVEGFDNPHVISIPIINTNESMTIGWIKMKGHDLSPYANKYIDIIKENLSEETIIKKADI